LYLKGHSDFSGGQNPSKKNVLKAVKKTLGFMETNFPFSIQTKTLGSDLNIEIRRKERSSKLQVAS